MGEGTCAVFHLPAAQPLEADVFVELSSNVVWRSLLWSSRRERSIMRCTYGVVVLGISVGGTMALVVAASWSGVARGLQATL